MIAKVRLFRPYNLLQAKPATKQEENKPATITPAVTLEQPSHPI